MHEINLPKINIIWDYWIFHGKWGIYCVRLKRKHRLNEWNTQGAGAWPRQRRVQHAMPLQSVGQKSYNHILGAQHVVPLLQKLRARGASANDDKIWTGHLYL
jgi:hypothetical protein